MFEKVIYLLLVAWNGLMKCTIIFKVSWFFSPLWEPLCYRHRNHCIVFRQTWRISSDKWKFLETFSQISECQNSKIRPETDSAYQIYFCFNCRGKSVIYKSWLLTDAKYRTFKGIRNYLWPILKWNCHQNFEIFGIGQTCRWFRP